MKKQKYLQDAVNKYPAPKREQYWTGRDYAMACMRCYDRRLAYKSKFGYGVEEK